MYEMHKEMMRWHYLVILLILFIGAFTLRQPFSDNGINLTFLAPAIDSVQSLPPISKNESCNQTWLRSTILVKRNEAISTNAMSIILDCGIRYVSLLQAISPLKLEYAVQAVTKYPENSETWFWLGEASTPIDSMAAQSAYLKVVQLKSTDGLAWCRLGSNYEKSGEAEQAQSAFFKCCIYGDSGLNGCYGAGRMAEKLGEPPKAIEYYHLSEWEVALKRADELEDIIK